MCYDNVYATQHLKCVLFENISLLFLGRVWFGIVFHTHLDWNHWMGKNKKQQQKQSPMNFNGN